MFINLGTQKLFEYAILESGTSGFTIPTLSEFEEGYDTIFKEIGCERNSHIVDCMKNIPPEILANNTLVEVAESFPVIDGDLLEYQPVEAVRKGYISRIPILLGSNTNEVINIVLYLLGNIFRHQGH